jgi:hypothetical protein
VKEAIGQVLSLGLGVALSPVPIIAVVLMLATPRGRVNGPAFVGGWIAGLTVVGTIVLLVSSAASASDGGAPATWVSWLKIALGAVLLLVALSAINPKNLLLTVAAAAAIAQTVASTVSQAVAL